MQIGTAFTLPRDIDADLDRWLAPFLDVTGRSTRRRMAPLYVRGLLGPDGPKSIQPMAERLGLSGHDQLHHFITSPAWDDTPLWGVLAEQADQLVGGPDAVLVVDDSGMPKKGEASVGVAPQYCGALGKTANCQSGVFICYSSPKGHALLDSRLYLPKCWFEPEFEKRRQQCRIPEKTTFQTKQELALELLKPLLQSQQFGGRWITCDCSFGNN